MVIRVLATVLLATLVVAAQPGSAAVDVPTVTAAAAVDDTSGDDTSGDDTTRPTVNEFLPQERALGDCLGALQRPNCGSDARGGWGQTVVFLALLAGLAFIAWRVVAASRRADRPSPAGDDAARAQVDPGTVNRGTPDATSAPDAAGGGPPP